MDIKDICNAGGDIMDAVVDAINRNDYSGLSDNVSNTVSRVVDQVREEAGRGVYGNPTHQYGKTTYTRRGQASYRRGEEQPDTKYSHLYSGAARKNGGTSYRSIKKNVSAPPAVVTRTPAGRISGMIELIWGILATSGFGITALVMLIMVLVSGGTVYVVLTLVFGLLTGLSVVNIVHGGGKIGLVNRFYHYARLIGNRSYIAIEELASQTGRSADKVLRDLRKMTKKHMFLQGRFDSGQTTFMLTQDAWQQYLKSEQGRKSREQEQELFKKQEERLQKSSAYDAETKKILKDGNDYIRTVHECNERIPDAAMSDKLSKLELTIRRIFEHVEKHPESADDLHKFMDYYLPTTTKLLYAYLDLDRQQIAGENITATKREIENTLDTINSAFERLLDGLFEDTAWDISSDISVMKTMMAQEGLTENKDFKL